MDLVQLLNLNMLIPGGLQLSWVSAFGLTILVTVVSLAVTLGITKVVTKLLGDNMFVFLGCLAALLLGSILVGEVLGRQ